MSSSFLEAVDRRNADTYLSPPSPQLPRVFSVVTGSFLLTRSSINEIENELKGRVLEYFCKNPGLGVERCHSELGFDNFGSLGWGKYALVWQCALALVQENKLEKTPELGYRPM